MKRITTNDDIRFPIRVVKGLDSDVFTIQFYTTSKAVNITKTNEDVVDGIIHLEWTELYPLGTGVMNYTVLIPEEDGSYSDDTFNKSISGTTIFYIVSNIIVPDGDDAQNLIDLVAELDTKLDAEIARSTGRDNAHDTAIAGKADKNGSISESFNTYTLNLRREGANTSLYNYNLNGEEYVSFYDRTGGSLTYHFTPNQGDNIATERQLAEKANISDVYTKEQADLLINSSEGLLEEPTEKIPKYSTSHPIRILGIGNSYMTEGTRELEGFLTAEGLTEDELDLEIAYYPARTLEAWYEAIRDGGGYEQLVQFKYNSGNHKWYRTAEHNVANIRDTISGKAWDLIVLQEFPSFSSSNPHASEYYSYYETLSSVITLCKSLCPNSQVQFGWHMIWSNDQYIANNYMVWQNICDASKRTAKLSDVSFIIPSATALQNAYNTSYFRGYEHHFLLMDQIGHPAAGAARYIIGATWFESLIAPIFGRSLIGNGYVPSFISDGTVTYQDAEVEVNSGNVLLAKLCAISSILDKYDVNHELEKKLNLYYTKTQTDALLDSKADRSGSDQYTFTAKKLGLQNEGAAMVLYNYIFDNHDIFEIYDNEGGTLQYVFSGNNDKIATERQLELKANSTDVYTKGEVDTALTGKANTGDVYTKGEVDTKLAGKANTNGSNSQSFTANAFNLQKDGASTTLYNYKDTNNREFVSFYDQTGGSLTYQFTANQGDKIATERQLALKANSADVYTKSETYTKSEVENLIDEHVPELPDNVVTDANYVHTDNNFTTTLKNKLDGLDGKQVTYVNVSIKSSHATFTDLDGNTLTLQQSLDLLRNKEKDLVLIYLDDYYNLVNFTDEDNFLDITFAAATNSGNGGFRFLNLSYYYEPGSEDTYITASSTINYIPSTLNHLGSGYFNTTGTSTTAINATTTMPFSYTTGGILIGHFSVDVGANATLNISGKGAKSIYYQEAAIQAGVIKKGDNALFQFYNNRFNLICTDHPASGGGVQSNWNETDTTSLAYIQNKPTIPDITANTNVYTGTTMKFFDGVDNYVTISGDYDSDLDTNTLRFTDLYSGNSVLFSLAPGGYRFNIGDQKTNITQMPAAVDGVSTVVLTPGYNLLPSRFWRTAQVNFMLPEASYVEKVTPEYYIYIPKNGAATHTTTSVTFDWSSNAGYTYMKLYWKDGTAPDIIGNATNYQIIKITLLTTLVALGEQYIYS